MGKIKKEKRGGLRRGAGSKRKLNWEKRLWVWNYYHFWKSRAELHKVRKEVKYTFKGNEIEKLQKLIHQLSEKKAEHEKRANYIAGKFGKNYRKLVLEYGEILYGLPPKKNGDPADMPDEWLDLFPEYMQDRIEAYCNLRRLFEGMQVVFSPIRLNGEASVIRQRVAKDASEKFGKVITPQYVKYIMDDRKREIRSVLEEYV